MSPIKDNWLLQTDVQGRLVDSSHWSSEWIAVEERRDSYVEHFLAICVPIRLSRTLNTLAQVSWGEDFDYTVGRISRILIGKRHYLSLRFRRFFSLTFRGHNYLADKNTIVKREQSESETGKTDLILARRDFVLKYLRATKQKALWCIRSQRYSERKLGEFKLKPKSDYLKGDNYHYFVEQSCLRNDQKEARPRMSTMTQVFGKSLLSL